MTTVLDTAVDYEANARAWLATVPGATWEDIRYAGWAKQVYPDHMIRDAWDFIGAVMKIGGFHVFATGPLDVETAYFAFMHEMGHVKLGHQDMSGFDYWWMQMADPQRVVQMEVDAWTWAFDHSDFTPSDQARLIARASLMSYEEGLNRKALDIHPYLED